MDRNEYIYTDLFREKALSPMLIGGEGAPFESREHIYELLLSGQRCLAFLDRFSVSLRTGRKTVTKKYPGLWGINRDIIGHGRCILDGTIVFGGEDGPDFYNSTGRTILTNEVPLEDSITGPRKRSGRAAFVAFDILYLNGEHMLDRTLLERRAVLSETVLESARLRLSRITHDSGGSLYRLAEVNGLGGIVAKEKRGRYVPGRRNSGWIKIKYLTEEVCFICGFISRESFMAELVLAMDDGDGGYLYAGTVMLSMDSDDFELIRRVRRTKWFPFELRPEQMLRDLGEDYRSARWLEPVIKCGVSYETDTLGENPRRAVFNGLRLEDIE